MMGRKRGHKAKFKAPKRNAAGTPSPGPKARSSSVKNNYNRRMK